MIFRSLLYAAAVALPLSVWAQAPNLTPGEWEFVTKTTVEGDVPIPEETQTNRECLTQEVLNEANEGLIQEEEGCKVLEQNASSDAMNYRMVCMGEGGEAIIVGDMQYMVDRAKGTMQVETTTPMGDMTMNTMIDGRRMGDC
ncbi:hypothetical protein L861_08825 [Litchfieldella anticariensis FP35 = DSM 16096]|uniref:DUF3617 domain-containing protein n=1 Tax=Litchfieldella anticariensis (strain DSM 16096 / CECT 5854 / CIP 108499 / LMG 22089 / FP35) TaxID=1121939 RepID=S2KK27_LITA3|nr:DUF3617 family protein [Halomonas anticariensis]EPC02467.1 hypothetical protein L861_08825 [Halomonas anticariensis FP35 = DSM 16096]